MSKYEPKNQEEAFCYQFEDDIKLLKRYALLNDTKQYLIQLDIIISHIDICKELINLKISNKNNYEKEKEI